MHLDTALGNYVMPRDDDKRNWVKTPVPGPYSTTTFNLEKSRFFKIAAAKNLDEGVIDPTSRGFFTKTFMKFAIRDFFN